MPHEIQSRKRIWEVECVSLDAALASSFEWKDLANLLQGFGIPVPFSKRDGETEISVHNLIHKYCHSENSLSLAVENSLNLLHRSVMLQIGRMDRSEILELVNQFRLSPAQRLGGIFWALGTDSRSDASCLNRRFQQRFQILTMRSLAHSMVQETV